MTDGDGAHITSVTRIPADTPFHKSFTQGNLRLRKHDRPRRRSPPRCSAMSVFRSPVRVPKRAAAVIAAAALAGSLATSLAAAGPAAADNGMPHDPIGAVWSVTATSDGLEMTGWAADPDALTTNLTVTGFVDSRATPASVVTAIRRPRVAKAHHTGPTP